MQADGPAHSEVHEPTSLVHEDQHLRVILLVVVDEEVLVFGLFVGVLGVVD